MLLLLLNGFKPIRECIARVRGLSKLDFEAAIRFASPSHGFEVLFPGSFLGFEPSVAA